MFPIIVGFLIYNSKRYSIYCIVLGNIDVEKGESKEQVQQVSKRKFIRDLIRRFIYIRRRDIIQYKLNIQQNLQPTRSFFKSLNKETLCNFNNLICLLTRPIHLKVISCAIKQLHSQFYEQGYPELTKEVRTMIGDQLTWKISVNQI